MRPSGIEPATFPFVAQYLNHCATAVPLPLCHREDPVPILQEAENLVPTGIRSPTVLPVAQPLYRLSYPVHKIFYFTCLQNMKLVTTEFKSGGLHEKHVVATWNLVNHLSICL